MAWPWERFTSGGAVLALVASCNTASLDGSEAVAASVPAAEEAAAASVVSEDEAPLAATMASAPAPAGPSDFVFRGELEQGGWIRGQVPAGTFRARLNGQALALDEAGRFFAAFDRDAGPNARLIATLRNGSTVEADLAVARRPWSIQHVNVAKGTGGGSAAWWAKREPEWTAIRDARARETGATGWQQDFVWPVKGRISGYFGRQRIYRGEPGSYHSGIDIAPGNGVPFVAPADGVVVLARQGFSLEGNIIILDHGAGLNSAFIHASKIVVSEGESVRQGQYIGNVGATGRATGPHLHWSLKWHDARLDPLLFTGPMN